jgi:nucleotide-binding universal stress UspA family protein
MTQNGTILVCILPDLKDRILHQYLVNAVSFAKQIGVDVHFLTPEDTQEALSSALNEIPPHELHATKTVSHPIAGNWSPGVVGEAVKIYSCDLIVVPAGGITEDKGYGAQVRKDLLEQASAPILILSPKIDLVKMPIGSVLVPMSGEIRVSSALEFGLRLADRIHVPVDLLHVIIEEHPTDSPLEKIGDQPQHEYRDLLDRVLAEACPFSETKERARVRNLYHVQGTPSVEILKAANDTPSCALVVQWRGSLINGKAEILKDLLQQIVAPIFLLKTKAEQKSILKIGPERRVA